MLCILSVPRRADYHGRPYPIRRVHNERQELWNRCLLIRFFNMGQSFMGYVTWVYPCRQFLLIWRTPPNYQQTDLSVQLYLLGECSPMVTPVLITRVAAPFRLLALYFFRLPSFGTDSFFRSGLASHSTSTQVVGCLLSRWGGVSSPIIPRRSSFRGWLLGSLPAALGPACPRYASI
jgi:hypothetical protein